MSLPSSQQQPPLQQQQQSFELQTKADEWIDVTPTEEVLRADLARLQAAFEKCTTQLGGSRLENDLLHDKSLGLENELGDPRSVLETAVAQKSQAQSQLAALQHSSQLQQQSLEASLRSLQASSQESIRSLSDELFVVREQGSAERSDHQAIQAKLEGDLRASRAVSQNHQDQHQRLARDLTEVQESHHATKTALEAAQRALAQEEEKHSLAKTDLGKVATLAEALRAENQSLRRSLAQQERAAAQAKTAALQQFLEQTASHDRAQAALRSELSERSRDLEGSNASLAALQGEILDAQGQLRESARERALRLEHLATMEEGRHGLLERQSELQEALEEASETNKTLSQQLVSTKELLDTAIVERDTLRTQRSNSEREQELETKLLEQQKAFEKRLKDIHTILGLTFATAVRSEVRTIRNTAIEQMPKSFRVPLLAQQPQGSTSSTAGGGGGGFHHHHRRDLALRQEQVESS